MTIEFSYECKFDINKMILHTFRYISNSIYNYQASVFSFYNRGVLHAARWVCGT